MPPVKAGPAYLQFGADGGRLVVYFHGVPGAPEECALFDRYGEENGLTFICYQRFAVDPALGEPAYYRQLADAIADKADGNPVDLVGFSIGGFVALQVCRLLDNVRSLHLVSAAAPLEAGDFIDLAAGKSVFRLAQAHPLTFKWLVRLQGLLVSVSPGLLFRMLFAGAAGDDKRLAADQEFQAFISAMLASCFTGNADGYRRDVRAYVQPWQDMLSGMTVETHVWHGAEDNWSPAAMAQYLVAAVPGCALSNIFDGLSHYSCLYRAAPEICRKLALNFRET